MKSGFGKKVKINGMHNQTNHVDVDALSAGVYTELNNSTEEVGITTQADNQAIMMYLMKDDNSAFIKVYLKKQEDGSYVFVIHTLDATNGEVIATWDPASKSFK